MSRYVVTLTVDGQTVTLDPEQYQSVEQVSGQIASAGGQTIPFDTVPDPGAPNPRSPDDHGAVPHGTVFVNTGTASSIHVNGHHTTG